MVMLLDGLELFKVSRNPAKFGGHRHCGRDVFSIDHVILKDRVTGG